MDALTHCIEAVLSPLDDPPAEAIGLDGVERIIRKESLIRACEDGQDKDARWNMMMASTEGAMAFSKGLRCCTFNESCCWSGSRTKIASWHTEWCDFANNLEIQ